MFKTLANIASYFFHPLLIPTFGLIIIFNSGTYLSCMSFEGQRAIYFIVFITTFILPLSVIPFFIYLNVIKNIFIDNNKERIIPLVVTFIFYMFSYYILNNIDVPKVIQIFILSAAITILIATIITYFWKISTHMIGVGGLIGVVLIITFRLMVNVDIITILLILIAGFVGTSRLYLKAHNSAQVYTGFALGLFTVCSTFYFF
ncbi:MAG: hypothetical protein KAT68_11220 [Bacteroidales bacterium]|nr:hypothetical protein [Bacteroidales bacterium]